MYGVLRTFWGTSNLFKSIGAMVIEEGRSSVKITKRHIRECEFSAI